MVSIAAFLVILFLLALSVGAIIFGYKTYEKRSDDWRLIVWGVGVACTVLMAIILIIAAEMFLDFRVHEGMNYAELIAEHESLETSIQTTVDIVNTDLYLRIADHNKEVAKMAAAYKSSLYTFQFSHKYDWGAIQQLSTKR